ncbi:hypothetical protein [Kangiella taiwanensis]|uniref:Uncharacterized protein n=1 Tax=Kangiella taiwanensis TaxID=1079179 RepID=A0ABP8HXS0_9GAMM|nr:hypothetical protein [Kangiella taiwanensis]
MKTVTLSIAVATAVLATSASANQTPAEIEQADSRMTASQDYRSFYYPKRPNQYGQLDYIFINATNGTQFCEEEGYRDAIGGSIGCGEDESSYVTYDWYQQRWESQSTGSKNQCYPVYRTITCGSSIPELP